MDNRPKVEEQEARGGIGNRRIEMKMRK